MTEQNPPLPPVPAESPPVRQEELLEDRLKTLLEAQVPAVLMTVIHADDAIPRRGGIRALLTPAGIEGSIGGGLLESQALVTAQSCLESGLSAIFHYDSGGQEADCHTCFSRADILCECLKPEQADLFGAAGEALRQGGRGIWLVDVTDAALPRRSLLLSAPPEGMFAQWQALLAKGQVRSGMDGITPLLRRLKNRSGVLGVKGQSLYIEPLSAPPVLLVCGGGSIARAVAPLAHGSGFIVDVVDDRPEFADPGLFPQARRCLALPGLENLLAACGVGPRHYVAILTPDDRLARRALSQALTSHARYIGMIGSKAKHRRVCEALLAEGVPAAELAAICCPIGLSIGAETPNQMAVAIVAELLAASSGSLQRLRNPRI